MRYRIITKKLLGIRVYYPQELKDGHWQDLEWGYTDIHTIRALSLDAAKRKLREWKHNIEPDYEVVYEEDV